MTRATMTTTLTGQAELLAMLAYKRPAWSKTERSFINHFIRPLGVEEDAFGNLYKRIGTAPVLWSSHTDTVHNKGGKQLLTFASGIVRAEDVQSNCLGADCTAGVWLMIQMIRAGKHGLYVFHRAEEIGGRGSEFIASKTPELLDGIAYAIAFDRKGHSSVITRQAYGRCCSEAFAASLGDALGMGHTADSGGTFTDTANYTGLVGECTNLSVGYMNEHTKRESLDWDYLDCLRGALLSLDVGALVSSRAPGEIDAEDFDSRDWGYSFDDEDQEPMARGTTLASLVRDHPDDVADWLEEYGITADEIATAIYLRGGVLRRHRR